MGFEPTIPAGERPKTYALDRAATGTGLTRENEINFSQKNYILGIQLHIYVFIYFVLLLKNVCLKIFVEINVGVI